MTIEQVAAWGDSLTSLPDVRTQAPSLRVIDCNLLDETVAALNGCGHSQATRYLQDRRPFTRIALKENRNG